MDNSSFYFDVLYPFQDRVIKVLNQVNTDFYLTGGTASSRGFLQHRFSDDLDYFVNDDDRFGLWVERIIQALTQSKDWSYKVLMKEAISGARGKAIGIFPADLARVLCSVQQEDWQAVRWIKAPPAETFMAQLIELGEGLLLP